MKIKLISLLVLVIVVGIFLHQIYKIHLYTSKIASDSKNYIEAKNMTTFSTTPLEVCIVCIQGETWNNSPCCVEDFDTNCSEKNGVVRKFDLHPAFNSMKKGCFQKAPDTGKECTEDKECLSGVCNLEDAIQSGGCTLIKKELTGEKNFYSKVDFYTATYSCDNSKPGVCAETITNGLNPEGTVSIFKMMGQMLVETQYSGPIR